MRRRFRPLEWVMLLGLWAPIVSGEEGVSTDTTDPGVEWICNGTPSTGSSLQTTFEHGAVIATWRGTSFRLDHTLTEVGTKYQAVDSRAMLWLRPDERAVFDDGEQTVGCRARREQTPASTIAKDEPLAVAKSLITTRPRTLSEFEAIVPIDRNSSQLSLGPHVELREEGMLTYVWIDYDIDFYHPSANDESNPDLAGWQLSLHGSDAGLHQFLRSRFGEGIELPYRKATIWRFGPFYWRPQKNGHFELHFARREPDWVVATRDPETERREIERVMRLLRGSIDQGRLSSALAPLGPFGPDQWGESLQGLTPHWRIYIKPAHGKITSFSLVTRGEPIPAGSLIPALGIKRPVVVARDQHGVLRELEDAELGKPSVAGYDVEIAIETKDLEVDSGGRPQTWTGTTFPIRGITLRQPPSWRN